VTSIKLTQPFQHNRIKVTQKFNAFLLLICCFVPDIIAPVNFRKNNCLLPDIFASLPTFEQLISNKLAQKEYAVFLNLKKIFLNGCANFILMLVQPLFLRNWLEQQNWK